MQIRTYDVKDVLELLNSHDQELSLYHLAEIRKQNVLEEEPKPKETTMTVLKLAQGLWLIEAGTKMSEDIDWNEQPTATR